VREIPDFEQDKQQGNGSDGPALLRHRGTGEWVATIGSRWGLVLVWAAMIAFFSVVGPSYFLSTTNFATIFSSQVVLLVLALGLLIPLTAGEFDLSVAGVTSLSLVLVGYLNTVAGWPIGLAILAALAAGLVIGLLNSLFIVVVGVDSIVVTLGMGTLAIGLGYGIKTDTSIGISSALTSAVQHSVIGNLQIVFLYGVGLTFLVWYVFSYTPLGRYLFFVGAGRTVARLAGIRVDAIRVGALCAASVTSALAGVLLAGTLGAAAPNIAGSYLLPAFTAVFLGATTITPGRFNPWGTFVATYFLLTGITGLQQIGYVGWIEQVFYGAALIGAVALSKLAGKVRLTTPDLGGGG
jgi:ribose transport system permease protein